MKQLNEYITESMGELYHFTHAGNLLNIIKNDEWTGSTDDGEIYYISTTRTKNAEIGYPTQMWASQNVVRIVFNAKALNNRYKIMPVDKMNGKKMAIKANWQNPKDFDQNKEEIMKQGNVEAEDRVLLKDEVVKNIHKYISSIHLNAENIEDIYINPIKNYCDKYDINLIIYPNTKKFNIGH